MKKDDVVVGQEYLVPRHGVLTRVRIISEHEITHLHRTVVHYSAINLKTNRKITLRSAIKLRPIEAPNAATT